MTKSQEIFDSIATSRPCRVCQMIEHDNSDVSCPGFPSPGDLRGVASWAASGEYVSEVPIVRAATQIESLWAEVDKLRGFIKDACFSVGHRTAEGSDVDGRRLVGTVRSAVVACRSLSDDEHESSLRALRAEEEIDLLKAALTVESERTERYSSIAYHAEGMARKVLVGELEEKALAEWIIEENGAACYEGEKAYGHGDCHGCSNGVKLVALRVQVDKLRGFIKDASYEAGYLDAVGSDSDAARLVATTKSIVHAIHTGQNADDAAHFEECAEASEKRAVAAESRADACEAVLRLVFDHAKTFVAESGDSKQFAIQFAPWFAKWLQQAEPLVEKRRQKADEWHRKAQEVDSLKATIEGLKKGYERDLEFMRDARTYLAKRLLARYDAICDVAIAAGAILPDESDPENTVVFWGPKEKRRMFGHSRRLEMYLIPSLVKQRDDALEARDEAVQVLEAYEKNDELQDEVRRERNEL